MGRRRGILSRARNRARTGHSGQNVVVYLEALLKDPCVYCQRPGCDSFDHINPRSKKEELATGGLGLNHWTNLAPCHKRCNGRMSSAGIIMTLVKNGEVIQ